MTLKIIGAGFGRTGTNSLKLALEQLGFDPCHHMFELRDHPHLTPDWQAVASGKPANWDVMFDGYQSQVDWPGARYWKELSEHYPKAKVILSVRDAERWCDSFLKTIAKAIHARGQRGNDSDNARSGLAYEIIMKQIFEGNIEDRDHLIGIYNDHIREVKETIPRERLLVYDVRQGWEPLAGFLEVDIPSTPFPSTNSTNDFQNIVLDGGANKLS